MSDRDQLDRLSETLKNGASLAGLLALEAAAAARERAGKLADAVRLRAQAARVEGEVEEKLMEAGGMVYATHTGSPTESEELVAKLREIDELKARLAELNAELGRKRACSACGAPAGEGDAFCRECGEKL